MAACQVLRVNGAEEQADYTEAVAEMLRRIQVEHVGHDGKPITLYEIAEAIDVSLGTISNAANKKGVLNPLYLGVAWNRSQRHPIAGPQRTPGLPRIRLRAPTSALRGSGGQVAATAGQALASAFALRATAGQALEPSNQEE